MANKTAKLMAILALGAILVSIVGTGILFFMGGNTENQQTISEKDLKELMQETASGNIQIKTQ